MIAREYGLPAVVGVQHASRLKRAPEVVRGSRVSYGSHEEQPQERLAAAPNLGLP